MTEIYVIRHVQAEGNLYRHMQGHWDGDVTPMGRQQRDALSLRFRDIPVDAVYSSDLYRAYFTATAITRFHDLPIRTDKRLREINIGRWEAAPFANIFWEEPERIASFMGDPEHFSMPGAETYHDVQKRAVDALCEIAEANPDRTVVITTHGITIRCLLCWVLGSSLNDTETVPIFHNTGVAKLCYEDGRFTVETINDASHLRPDQLRRVNEIPSLRHEYIDPAACRELYERCYADAWIAAHGDLRGFDPAPYFRSACDHHRADPESIMLLYEKDRFAGLIDLDTERGRHANYGWVSLFYLTEEYRGRGLGVQLLGRAVAKYRNLGRAAIRLHVADDNEMAKAFYRANEFEELSQAPGGAARLLLMEKKLRGDAHGGL